MEAPAKQQIVERVKQAENILVTVSKDPTVDQLAAAIGLTLLLNKMNKHATAVFSGKIPSTIEFLQPEKTLETNTDRWSDMDDALNAHEICNTERGASDVQYAPRDDSHIPEVFPRITFSTERI